jgi:hypothetical protein
VSHIDQGHYAPLDYHRRLLDDPWRLDAYDRALRLLVEPGMRVIDIGTGTGVLAMLAAKLGARVHAVESTPVADLAEQLFKHNGLHDRIHLHRADASTWTPPEPVDLVIGDWMGRFIVDDGMLNTVVASSAWLRPGGRCCPSHIAMHLAPAGDFHVPMTDRWQRPLLGLDLSPALQPSMNTCYGSSFPVEALLSTPQTFVQFRPPKLPDTFSRTFEFVAERDGLFRGFLGFWDATLAPGITLKTGPGHQTHWGQILFPAPATPIRTGERLQVSFALHDLDTDPYWSWKGSLLDSPSQPWSLDSRGHRHADKHSLERREAASALRSGLLAVQEGAYQQAVELLQAATIALDPRDPLCASAYANLGLALLQTAQPLYAVQALLRAQDPENPQPDIDQLLKAALSAAGLHEPGSP